jgi:hypothetical protein
MYPFQPPIKRALSRLFGILIFSIIVMEVSAADLVFVSPIKNNCLLLHFREGEKNLAECHDFNSANCPDIWNSGPLDEGLAKSLSTYTITSTVDSRYTAGQNPVGIGYKAKNEASLMSYWVFLELPYEMIENSDYTIHWGGLASNRSAESFSFDSKNLRSESVHLNQVGYALNSGMKYAYVYQWLGTAGGADFSSFEGNNFYLVRHSDSSIVYSSQDHGKSLQKRTDIQLENPSSSNIGWHGCDIWECDFSDIGSVFPVDPGEYRIAIEGIGSSFPFRLDKDVYSDLSRLLLRGLYHQRSGPERTTEHTAFVKPVDHTPGVNGFQVTYSNHLYQGNDQVNFEQLPANATEWVWPDNPYPFMNEEPDGWGWGGYFDAADCDRRRPHMAVSADLLLVYEMNPGKFQDGELNIPESNNGLPDILDEARWGIDFFRRLKGPTGGISGGLETTGYYHPSWEDNHMWYAYAEDPITSWQYAGLAAHLAYCLELANEDEVVINDWITESENAYSWAGIKSPGNEGKDYIVQKYYAAANLYRITGNYQYLEDLKECLAWYGDMEKDRGSFVYCLTSPDRWDNFTGEDKELQENLMHKIKNKALTEGIDQARERGMRYIRRSNWNVSWGGYYPHVMLQMVYHHLSDDDEILDYLFTTADLYLGANNDLQVSISGAAMVDAERTFRDLLNLESTYDDVPGWIPGIPPYKHTNSVYNASYFKEPVDPKDWPLMEQNNDIRYYVPAGEYTVYETITPLATLFSYLKSYSSGKQMLVSIDFPGSDSLVMPGNSITVDVSASAYEGIITSVKLFDGDSLLGEDTSLPWSFSLENLQSGIYDLRARAYSDDENQKSNTVQLIVDGENPTIPGNLHITRTERTLVGIAWSKSTDDAGVKHYEVFVNDSLWTLPELNYINLENLKAGSEYSIYVEAVDYAGRRSGPGNMVTAQTLSGHRVPGRIEAEDYDQVVGDVQTDDAQDVDGGDYVGWFDGGESLEYAIQVDSTGTYAATFRVARGIEGDDFQILLGTEVIDTINIPNTGGWVEWINVISIFHLEAGEQTFIIKNTGNPFNINWVELEIAIPAEAVIIENCPSDSIVVGNNYTLQAGVLPDSASDRRITWISSDESVATVSSDGTVTALSPGSVTITVNTAWGGFEDICLLKLYSDPSKVISSRGTDFRMYPNPNHSGSLTIEGQSLVEGILRMYDMQGRIIYLNENRQNSRTITIYTGDLPAGIYFVNVINQENCQTMKLVIE